MDNDIIQLSAGTEVDLSVCKLTPHQVEWLQKLASQSTFNGLLEPDFNQTRASGPFVCTWLSGTRRHQCLVGRYRTMPWPQRGQFAQLQAQNMSHNWKPLIFKAVGTYSFKDRPNDNDSLREEFEVAWAELLKAWDERDQSKDFSFPHRVLRMARDMIVLGNLAFAEELTKRYDSMSEEVRNNGPK